MPDAPVPPIRTGIDHRVAGRTVAPRRPARLAALASLAWAVACAGPAGDGRATAADAPPAACRTDADCVPATCCHPSACVPRAAAPDCAGVVCTRHCAPGTLDCGGRCACRDGRCEAVPADRPSPRDVVPAP